MRQKLKDVETYPFMLAIYKDNEYHHLARHALKCWKLRRPGESTLPNYPGLQLTNPLRYCQYPPMDLVLEYYQDGSAMAFLNSKVLKCPVVARWAFEQQFDSLVKLAETIEEIGIYERRTIGLIEFDEELIFKIVTTPLARLMPQEFHDQLNDEQRATMAICA